MSGQAIVEYGIVSLFVIILVTSGVDLGLALSARQTVATATTMAGHQASYGEDVVAVGAAARNFAAGSFVNGPLLDIQVQYCDSSGQNCIAYCDYHVLSVPPGCMAFQSGKPQSNASPPKLGDQVIVSVIDNRHQVVTPGMAAGFRASGAPYCQDQSAPCYISFGSSVTVPYGGL
jgi:hypothetical protein